MTLKSPKPDPFFVLLTMAGSTFVMMLSEEADIGELVDLGEPILTACDIEGINKPILVYCDSTGSCGSSPKVAVNSTWLG